MDTLNLFDIQPHIEPYETLYVGDSPQDDIVGAKGVGMDIAWINARGLDLPEGIPSPDYTVQTITALEPILFS